ncbi:hypothetical protein [Clostridium sp. CAG:265]|uniref:hypothetical protein n=1 Tax=Clostridium sp. CAG:265 TaxID=1262787 RepID=UPI00033AA80C|nr:hypothetical protein [Clostridium sp. CAG:265]CDB75808.1 putative uncharacterized protein [Clostridium sp. CAG:265]
MSDEIKKNNKPKIIVMILVFFVLATGIYVIFNKKNKTENVEGASVSGYILEDGAEPGLTEDEIRELLQRQVDESSISFSISSDPIFKGKKAFLVMANPRYNAYDIDYVITVDGKELIRTAKIAPNQYIEEVELKEALPKGSYIGEALITGYNKETGAEVGKTIVELNITSQ